MRLRIRSISTVGVLSAAAAALILFAIMLSFGAGAMLSAAAAVCMFGIIYLWTYYIIRRFLIYKIKPIYQILLSKDIKTRNLTHELTHRNNILFDVENELSKWVDKNSREIAQLKENERFRQECIGDLSHEIKTPIFMAQGYILTLLEGAIDDPVINRKYLDRAEKSIDRLINIVNDLEQISMLESGARRLEKERFDIVALTREIADSLEIEAAKKGISVKLAGGQSAPLYVFADKKKIGQVLSNLIVNSIKYGKEGGATRISFIDMFEKIMVEVSDNGCGIASDNVPRIFERFFRVDKSRSREQGGTGLGLSIVKHIIEAHNETVNVRSRLGEGSTFSFSLTKY